MGKQLFVCVFLSFRRSLTLLSSRSVRTDPFLSLSSLSSFPPFARFAIHRRLAILAPASRFPIHSRFITHNPKVSPRTMHGTHSQRISVRSSLNFSRHFFGAFSLLHLLLETRRQLHLRLSYLGSSHTRKSGCSTRHSRL